ncbi:MAG TPA: ABC transporter substrate-binding protein [Bacillota bacterium]|nr:ABC transporter substrate-binding protein [Bacillota bacterium]
MKKSVVVSIKLLLLVTLFLVSGFVAGKNITLTVLSSQDQIRDAEVKLAEKFTQKTGIKIDFQIIPSEQFDNLLATRLNSGECTDLFMGQSGTLIIGPKYNVTKNCVDLTGEPWTKRFDPTVLSAVTFNKKVYGCLLWDVSNPWCFVYNKQVFKKLGITAPKTYADFKAACETIKAAGITPIYEPISDGWHHVLMFPEMGARLNELHPGLYDQLNKNQIKLADLPEAQKLLKQNLEISQYFGKNSFADTYSDTSRSLATGQFAMTVRQPTYPVEFAKDMPDSKLTADDFGVFVMPFLDNQFKNMNPAGPAHFIYSGGKHIKESRAYLRFLTTVENAQFYLDNNPLFTWLPVTGVKPKESKQMKELNASVKKSGVVMQAGVSYIDPQWMQIGKDMQDMFLGQLTPKQVLQNVDKRRSEQALAQKDPAWAK